MRVATVRAVLTVGSCLEDEGTHGIAESRAKGNDSMIQLKKPWATLVNILSLDNAPPLW